MSLLVNYLVSMTEYIVTSRNSMHLRSGFFKINIEFAYNFINYLTFRLLNIIEKVTSYNML